MFFRYEASTPAAPSRPGEEHARLFHETAPRSAILAPLTVDGRTFGAITFLRTRRREPFDDEDFEAGLELGRRAALHIDRARALAELQSALAVKDELLGMVSHEIRTPVTMLTGASNILRRRLTDLSQADRDELLLDIERQASRLQQLTANLLALARESREARPAPEPLLLQHALAAAVHRFHDAHPASEILLEASDDLPPVLCDETSLDQLVSNLLDNALKYAGSSPVEISAIHEPVRRVVRVDIADRGPGVSSDALARIFEPFVRGASTRTYGLGLGLAVCERLVTALGGSISAAPREGGGAVFSFALPVLEG